MEKMKELDIERQYAINQANQKLTHLISKLSKVRELLRKDEDERYLTQYELTNLQTEESFLVYFIGDEQLKGVVVS